MQEYIEPYITADIILGFFDQSENRLHIPSLERHAKEKGCEAKNVRSAWRQLLQDEYVQLDSNLKDWIILIGKGVQFFNKGGYKRYFEDENKKEIEKVERDKLVAATNQSVIDTNKSVTETNTIQKNNIKLNNKLFWATFIVAVAGTVAAWVQVTNDSEKKSLSRKVEAKDSLLQQKERSIQQIENIRNALQKDKDSLLKILNSTSQ